jgi:hypothetical protein
MLDSSSPNLVRVSGVKRLLPAFEPSSSPPRFKRQKSRVNTPEDSENRYPSPLPSSSIGCLPSSPPAAHPAATARRPALPKRTASTVSERAPLSAVPSITLPANGDSVLLGRSSKSSDYTLSANRLISRVHVKATYIPSTNPSVKAKIILVCLGWNGVKVHCQGQHWELQKNDVFTSDTECAEIMLDVHDSRVLLEWPGNPTGMAGSGSDSAARGPAGSVTRSPSFDWEGGDEENIDPWDARRIQTRAKLTPISPTPRRTFGSQSMAETFLEIYEDEPVADFGDETQPELPAPVADAVERLLRTTTQDVSEIMTEPARMNSMAMSFDSEPVLPPMSTFSTADALKAKPATPPRSSTRPTASTSPHNHRRSVANSPNKDLTLQNHLTNQLAFSRVNTMTLSELYHNLPTALSAGVSKERVKQILSEVPCVGEIARVGKDAAGKPLEHQYYYNPIEDKDEGRKMAIGGRSGMRNCRKTHKVCQCTDVSRKGVG